MKPLAIILSSLVVMTTSYAQNTPWPASGNVGIGTTAPDEKLVVTGDGAALKINSASNPSAYYTKIVTNWDSSRPTQIFSNGTEILRTIYTSPMKLSLMPTGGNVGIGTVNPDCKLDVVGGSIRSSGSIISMSSSASGLFLGYGAGLDGSTYQLFALYADTTYGLYFDAPKDSGGNKVDIQFNWRGGGTPGLIIKGNSGNIGLGTVNPEAKLQIQNDSSRGVLADGIRVSRPNSANCYAFASYGGGSTGESGDTAFFGSVYAGGTKGRIVFRVSDGNDNLDAATIDPVGNVGIGTTNPTEKLSVNGKIRAKEVIVETTGWSDHVFGDNYQLQSLSEVEQHIKADKHLPGVPSAQDVAEKGVSVGDMQAILLAKIEELTLHQIAQEKELAALRTEVSSLKAENILLKAK